MTHWLFLIPLGTGLVSGYYSLRSSDDINILVGFFTLICLLVTLCIAPWELQLLIALLVVAAARYYWLKIDATTDIAENAAKSETIVKSASEMPIKLNEPGAPPVRTYRGIAYGVDPNLHPPKPGVNSPKPESISHRTYRGIPYDNSEEMVHALEQLSAQPPAKAQPKKNLKYRGVSIQPDDSETPPSKP